jgi:hypothetical protein
LIIDGDPLPLVLMDGTATNHGFYTMTGRQQTMGLYRETYRFFSFVSGIMIIFGALVPVQVRSNNCTNTHTVKTYREKWFGGHSMAVSWPASSLGPLP